MHIHFIMHASFEKPGSIDSWSGEALGMLTEAINELFSGDVDVGKAILRDYLH